MEEIWKSVNGYEGYYEVSNYGRVKSLERTKWGSSTPHVCSVLQGKQRKRKPE